MPINAHRPEIDALRGYAILAVLLFHADIPFFSGGFVGVDVFFVISGFLITRLILTDLSTRSFSFGQFFLRRARRLAPALLATVALTFIASAVLLSPQRLERMAASAIYAIGFVSNIGFWSERGYFDTEAELKPLLHTWSLAVEEQFYLFWPLLLLLAERLRRSVNKAAVTPAVLITAAVLSFASCLWMMQKDIDAAFFLTPFRVFEFALGGLVVFLDRGVRLGGALKELVATAGLALIAWSCLTYGPGLPFPGLAALPPCLGAAFALWAGWPKFLGPVFYSRPMRWLGIISYSLYLVHWPIISLAKYYLAAPLDLFAQLALIAASIAAAFILWRFVERPFRARTSAPVQTPPLRFSIITVTLGCIVGLSASLAIAGRGWTWRYDRELQTFVSHREADLVEYTWSNWSKYDHQTFEDKPERWLIIGDSQAADLINLIAESGQYENVSIRALNVDFVCSAIWVPEEREANFYSKQNILSAVNPAAATRCKTVRSAAFADPRLKSATRIFIAPLWFPWTTPYLTTTIQKIRTISAAPIAVVGRKSLLMGSIDIVAKFRSPVGIENHSTVFIDPKVRLINSELQTASKLQSVEFIDLFSLTCPSEKRCHVITRDGFPFMHNAAHYSSWGARQASRELTALLPPPGSQGAQIAGPTDESSCISSVRC
ncbi:MAG: acyltransferase family protein [Caulobacterales bacterium]